MPTYLYSCPDHGEFEIFHGIKEPARTAHEWFDDEAQLTRVCLKPIKRLIASTGGHVVEPNGVYRHVLGPPQIDPKTKRMKEEKITKAQFEREDRKLRDSMMDTRARAIKMGLTSEGH